jgi:hypothetical protein
MASAQASKKLSTEINVKNYDVDPDATTAFNVAYVDMRDYNVFMAGFFRTVGTSDLQTFKIMAAEDSDGTNAQEIKTGTVDPDALGDQVWLECTAQEIAHIGNATGYKLRYVTLRLQFQTGTDEGVATYVLGHPRFPSEGLTADAVA